MSDIDPKDRHSDVNCSAIYATGSSRRVSVEFLKETGKPVLDFVNTMDRFLHMGTSISRGEHLSPPKENASSLASSPLQSKLNKPRRLAPIPGTSIYT